MNFRTTVTTITSRQFNQDTAKAKRAAQKGPVFITTRGEPTHVLLSKAEFDRLEPRPRNLAEALAQTEGGDFDFEIPEMKGTFSLKPVNFD